MKNETCANCRNPIGLLEQACIFDGKVVCGECDKKLRDADSNKHSAISPYSTQSVVATPLLTPRPKSQGGFWKGLVFILLVLLLFLAWFTFSRFKRQVGDYESQIMSLSSQLGVLQANNNELKSQLATKQKLLSALEEENKKLADNRAKLLAETAIVVELLRAGTASEKAISDLIKEYSRSLEEYQKRTTELRIEREKTHRENLKQLWETRREAYRTMP